MSESRAFRRKNRAKWSQSAKFETFFFSFSKNYSLKNEKHQSILCCKSKSTYKFCVFNIKSALGNVSESNEFRFDSLKAIYSLSLIFSTESCTLVFSQNYIFKLTELITWINLHRYTNTQNNSNILRPVDGISS